MAEFQEEDRPRLKRHLVEEAINLAIHSRWADAVAINQKILEMFPNDVDALNRMGRAMTELGRYAEARAAYQKSVEIDPNNIIAQKNLRRLSNIDHAEEPARATEKLDLRLLSTEAGKAGMLQLVRVPNKASLSKMSVGDQVRLQIEGRALMVYNSRNEFLGQVDPRPSQRLIELMKGGNQYSAAILDQEEGHPRIIVQEVFQHPNQVGKISFPLRSAAATAIRPYVRESILQYGLEEEEEEEEGEFGPEAAPEAEEPIEEDFSDEAGSV
ncbi:MAG: tetratricopeptide repeat protein [Bacteroidetes bacterium]|nr:tetratricopeptide repeat protein [Bacteroidota bacterium]MCL5026367.1 tetratricopeptide repeat protein [Chloroflexota bacterium]